MKIHELNTLIGLLMILSHKHRINIISKIACCRITTGGSFCSFVKFCMHGFLFFRKPFCTHILFSPFFSLQSKKSSIRFWATSWVSVLKQVHIQVIILHELLKQLSLIYDLAQNCLIIALNQLLCDKHHEEKKPRM